MFISGVNYGASGQILHFGYFWRVPKTIFRVFDFPEENSVSKKKSKWWLFWGAESKYGNFKTVKDQNDIPPEL